MEASIFGGLMKHLKDLAERQLRCSRGGGIEKGICKLIRDTDQQVPVREGRYREKKSQWSNTLEGHLNTRSRTLCIALELWLSTWNRGTGQGRDVLTGDCKYKDFKKIMEGRGEEASCKKHSTAVNWRSYINTHQLNMKQDYQKELQLCMELVRIIYDQIKLTQQGNNIIVEMNNWGNICKRTYEKLADWGGSEVAKEVMRNWFNTDRWPSKGGGTMKLAGTDIFEVITEDLIGDDAGVKDLVCTYKGGISARRDLGVQEIASEGTKDTTWTATQAAIEGGVSDGEELRGVIEAYLQKTPLIDPGAHPGGGESTPEKNSGGVGADSLGGLIGGGAVAVILGGLSMYGLVRILKSRTGPRNSRALPVTGKRRVRYTP
ncbi:hypothetical protein C922_00005 [Plasmodium inui San Antonio 1]|uniref:Uncharacterized protein n=1 Tax=Plasmodium inui San Antonio 1 TaxID=1237626 RepID=W7A7J5_9APIC|nr:hypothetical protein C922_00005 [Plasmodium inui San Antonio 1]EUD69142.1 hypothetical protein C922_00005 [Plasmodium inui San Antonio 1]